MTKAEIQQLLNAGYDIAEIVEEFGVPYISVYNVSISPVNYNLDEEKLLAAVESGEKDLETLRRIGKCSVHQAQGWYYDWVKQQLANEKPGQKASHLAAVYNVPMHFIYHHCPKSKYKMTEAQWNKLLDRIEDGQITKSEASRESGASRATIDRKLRARLPASAAVSTANVVPERKPRGRYVRRVVPGSRL